MFFWNKIVKKDYFIGDTCSNKTASIRIIKDEKYLEVFVQPSLDPISLDHGAIDQL